MDSTVIVTYNMHIHNDPSLNNNNTNNNNSNSNNHQANADDNDDVVTPIGDHTLLASKIIMKLNQNMYQ